MFVTPEIILLSLKYQANAVPKSNLLIFIPFLKAVAEYCKKS